MHSWEKFDDTLLLIKETFFSNLNMKEISDVDYRHANTMWNCCQNKIVGDYHDLYFQSNTLLLADGSANFRRKCIAIYKLDNFHFFISTWISMETCLRMSEKKVELSTDVDMLLMVKKRIRGGICHVIHRYAIANNKYIKNGYIITTKDHLIFNI